MLTYPNDIEEKLGFNQIRENLVNFCQSDRGKALANKAKPTDNFRILEKWLTQVREMIQLKGNADELVSFEFPDIDDYLLQIKVLGTFLDPESFHFLKIGVRSIVQWNDFFVHQSEEYPELSSLSERVVLDHILIHEIDRVIDERGEVKDSASDELLNIRSGITKSERAARSAIQKVLKKVKDQNFTEDDSTLTVREGRLVIPIKAEYKKQINGFIHDESATGQTVFMEPGEVLEHNNRVKELKYAERREINRILVMLADQVRANLPGLRKGADLLEKLDYINAKAKIAQQLDGLVPNLVDNSSSQLINARHPLLYLSHKDHSKPVVPLTLELTPEKRILIISGPNAGGKSVALKTVGLLQYMVQVGLPIPVSEESKLGVFSSIFIDIGDTQSIEDDVSTYSAHLTSIKYFLSKAHKKTLFLIDEFGKGTEPQFGGAIAESVLIELNKKKSFGVITTHYQNLKKIGDEVSGLFNGAMKYDLDALEPLFELETGKPGSSFAFEIAGKIGLPDEIINKAKKSVGKTHVAYDKMLADLEKEKSKYEKLKKKVDRDQEELLKARKEYEDVRNLIEEDKGRIIKEAKGEAKRIIDGANKKIEGVVREIKEKEASKEVVKSIRAGLKQTKASFEVINPKKKKTIKEGDHVVIEGQEMVGEVRKINGNQAEVVFGGLKSIVGINKLEKTIKESPSYERQKKVKKMGIDLSSKMASFSHELSIRGLRADEALSKVESFIDEALLLGMDEVRIVHGKGHGVLRNIVRNFTKGHPGIESIADEHADRGGEGISIIRLQ